MEEILVNFKSDRLNLEQTVEKLTRLITEQSGVYYKSGYTDGYNAKKTENSNVGYFPGFVEG